MSEQFWIQETERNQPVAVIKMGGRLGANPAKDLRTLCASLRDQGFTHLVLNLSEITFISSSGVGALIVLTGESSISGGATYLAALSEPVRRTIELLNLGQFLNVAEDEASALKKIRIKT